MQSIEQTHVINAPVEKVWQALVDPGLIEEWGAGPVKMTEKENEQFSLWGGDIWGKNLQIEKNKTLKQEWTADNWPQPSLVTFTLTAQSRSTKVTLRQENIPDDKVKEIDKGWHEYYLGAIKELLEK